MPKVLSAQQVREWDAYTIQHEPIASIDLMERACRVFTEWFTAKFDATKKVCVVCGTGNNGGDGLGIARLLHEWNYAVKVWIVRGGTTESVDFSHNLQRLPGKIPVTEITSASASEFLSGCDVLIDAIFGSGLSRPAEGVFAQVINSINESTCTKVAVDIPSGLMADAPSTGAIVKAHFTFTFQLPKLSFFLPETGVYAGSWKVGDIGLSKTFLAHATTGYHYLTLKSVRRLMKERAVFSHKGDYGKALLVAGSHGKMGACVLAARAALRAGLGLLTVHLPTAGYTIVQTAVPEAMATVDDHAHFIATCPPGLETYDVIGVGPGLGTEAATAKVLRALFEPGKPMVIDADALNLISKHRELLHLIPPGSILTPHPKEFERLAGPSKNSFDRLAKQRQLAQQLKGVVLVKGAFTAIAMPDGACYFNTTGNPGMATGGTGDVLTGILTGLLAQGYPTPDAARLGVFLHGLSGDLARKEVGEQALIASDLVAHLAAAFGRLVA